jgi:putative peptidoglycan binding protein
MTERRDRDQLGPHVARGPSRPRDAGVLDLGGQAGNKAMAELLGPQPAPPAGASAGLRMRDALRAGRVPAQREFGLVAQRDLKDELKEPRRLLKVGTQGGDVRQLQELLHISADGIFGRNTRAAVLGFQQANGLAVDGIVGPITWSALVAQIGAEKQAPLAGAEKLPSSTEKQAATGETDKIPASTDKQAATGETDKIPASTEKIPESTEKIPESTEKIPASTDKIPSSTDKLEAMA